MITYFSPHTLHMTKIGKHKLIGIYLKYAESKKNHLFK